MAEVVPRIMDTYQNLVTAAASTLVASSEETSLPLAGLLDQLRSDVLRFKVGWTFGAENDKLDFNRGGVKVATIAHGTYATGAAVCTAIVAALEVADSTPVWAASYSGGAFQISSDIAFTLLNSTGANKANSLIFDLAWGAIDSASTTTQNAPGASYQSRQWIAVDLGVASDFQAAIAINHNLLASVGTMKIQASASTFVGVGLSATPTVSQTMTGDSAQQHYYFGSVQSYRYLRLLITDTVNSAGYSEVGYWFVGPYIAPRAFQPEAQDGTEPLDEIHTATNGAHYRCTRQTRDHWILSWNFITTAEKATLMAFIERVGVGGNFFFAFDASGSADNIRYCFFPAPPPKFEAMGNGTIWRWPSVPIAESLG